MKLSEDILLFKYCPGGTVISIIYLVKLPPTYSEHEMSTRIARLTAKIKPDLPEYHTRAMKRSVKDCVSSIADISPSTLDMIYSELTGDESVADNKVMRQRLQMAADGEPGIVPDLRYLNPGRPSNKFDVFWDEAEKVLNELSAVDGRRHGDETHMSEFISYLDLLERIRSRCPDGTPTPTLSTLRLQTSPSNKYTARVQAFTGRLAIQHKVQVRQLRAQHPDSHFCAAIFKYMRQRAVELQHVHMQMMDDKAKIPVGEPGLPVSTGVRVKPVPTASAVVLDACDHDVSSKGKLTPTVILSPVIPSQYDEKWCQGQVEIVIHDAILQSSNPFQNAALMLRTYRDAEADIAPPYLFKFSDGGSEHRNLYIKVQLSYIAIFKLLNLDMFIAARCAPGQSWINPVERIMSRPYHVHSKSWSPECVHLPRTLLRGSRIVTAWLILDG